MGRFPAPTSQLAKTIDDRCKTAGHRDHDHPHARPGWRQPDSNPATDNGPEDHSRGEEHRRQSRHGWPRQGIHALSLPAPRTRGVASRVLAPTLSLTVVIEDLPRLVDRGHRAAHILDKLHRSSYRGHIALSEAVVLQPNPKMTTSADGLLRERSGQ